jgi:hypothetical protein
MPLAAQTGNRRNEQSPTLLPPSDLLAGSAILQHLIADATGAVCGFGGLLPALDCFCTSSYDFHLQKRLQNLQQVVEWTRLNGAVFRSNVDTLLQVKRLSPCRGIDN